MKRWGKRAWWAKYALRPEHQIVDDERAETWAALEAAFGPRTWSSSLAEQAEPLGGRDEEPVFARDGMTLEEIGEVLGVSRERVRQIEQRALGKLRERLQGMGLADGRTGR